MNRAAPWWPPARTRPRRRCIPRSASATAVAPASGRRPAARARSSAGGASATGQAARRPRAAGSRRVRAGATAARRRTSHRRRCIPSSARQPGRPNTASDASVASGASATPAAPASSASATAAALASDASATATRARLRRRCIPSRARPRRRSNCAIRNGNYALVLPLPVFVGAFSDQASAGICAHLSADRIADLRLDLRALVEVPLPKPLVTDVHDRPEVAHGSDAGRRSRIAGQRRLTVSGRGGTRLSAVRSGPRSLGPRSGRVAFDVSIAN